MHDGIWKRGYRLFITLIVCCWLKSGCTPPPVQQHPPVDNTRVFNVAFDEVWAHMLSAVTTGEETLSFVDKNTGIMTFQKNIPVKQLDTYAFDDSGMLMSNATANVVVRIIAEQPNRTRIVMQTKITATGKDVLDVFLSRQRQVVLESKGWLEREYFDRITEHLKASPAHAP